VLSFFSDYNEYNIFQENYAQMCNTVTDIDELLKYFVTEKLITIFQEDDIKGYSTAAERVRKLLLIISGPLQSGDKNGFYTLLSIMKNYGTQPTKNLAESISSKLKPPTES